MQQQRNARRRVELIFLFCDPCVLVLANRWRRRRPVFLRLFYSTRWFTVLLVRAYDHDKRGRATVNRCREDPTEGPLNAVNYTSLHRTVHSVHAYGGCVMMMVRSASYVLHTVVGV